MFPCELRSQAPQPTLSIRFTTPAEDLRCQFGRAYTAVIEYLKDQPAQPAGPAFAIYYNMDMTALDVEAGFPVSTPVPGKGEIQAGEIPGEMFAICHYTGPYNGLWQAYDDLAKFVIDRGYAPSGVAYEWYLNGPDEVLEAELRTDIAFPIIRIEQPAPS
jgi:effector-binding domain-containing protein